MKEACCVKAEQNNYQHSSHQSNKEPESRTLVAGGETSSYNPQRRSSWAELKSRSRRIWRVNKMDLSCVVK